MTPVHSLLCLVLLSSSLGMTSKIAADDFNSTRISENGAQTPQKTHVEIDNLRMFKGHNDSRTKFNKGNINVINLNSNMTADHNQTINQNINGNSLRNKTNLNFINVLETNHTEIALFNYSHHNHVKQYKGRLRSWFMENKEETKSRVIRSNSNALNRTTREENSKRCGNFEITKDNELFSPGWPGNYPSNVECITTIKPPDFDNETIITMDFRDTFHIEHHGNCTYDFLEVRDGSHGYDDPFNIYCGNDFPKQFISQGPNIWVRFKSDSTIEYKGFKAVFYFNKSTKSRKPIEECTDNLDEAITGAVTRYGKRYAKCEENSKNRVDALWIINVQETHKIFLNFTHFELAFPNECRKNFVEVFGQRTDMTDRLKYFCGSMADTVISKTNVLHLRFVAVTEALAKTNFTAHYTAFRSVADDNVPCKTETEEEWDCDDATCIAFSLKCNNIANCRLKGDEDADNCKTESESPLTKPHIIIILVIFTLIFSGMSIVFFYRCIKKLVADHKIIKEQIRQSCEDRLDTISGGKMGQRLQREFLERERESLRRDNIRNDEMYKRQRTKDTTGSIESEDPFETRVEIDDDSWPLDIEESANVNGRHSKERSAQIKSKYKRDGTHNTDDKDTRVKHAKDVRSKRDAQGKETTDKKGTMDRKGTVDKRGTIERRDTIDKTDAVDKKDSFRDPKDRRGTLDRRSTQDRKDADRDTTDRRGTKDRKGVLDRKGTLERRESDMEETDAEDSGKRNVSVSFPDTKESGCQTRESLFQGGNGASSEGTDSSGARGFSTFGYSGSTLLPSHSPQPANSQRATPPTPAFTVEIMHPYKSPPSAKKMPERRPMSTETTRSAPDVIIVSKPVR